MNRLTIGPEGFVDLRTVKPAEKDQVNGWTPDNGEPAQAVESVAVPPKPEPVEPLPGRQKTTDGLERPDMPVLAPVAAKHKGLMRIDAVGEFQSYALVTPAQFEKFGKFEWRSSQAGKLYRMDEKGDVVWLHRLCARCFRSDRFVVFRNNDERLLSPNNLQVVASKEKMHELQRNARLAAGK